MASSLQPRKFCMSAVFGSLALLVLAILMYGAQITLIVQGEHVFLNVSKPAYTIDRQVSRTQSSISPYRIQQSLADYLTVSNFPRKLVGYTDDDEMMIMSIVVFDRTVESAYIEYRITSIHRNVETATGKGELLIDRELLIFPFGTYRIRVDESGKLVFEAVEWRYTPYTTLKET